jgi:hypothetical protein
MQGLQKSVRLQPGVSSARLVVTGLLPSRQHTDSIGLVQLAFAGRMRRSPTNRVHGPR